MHLSYCVSLFLVPQLIKFIFLLYKKVICSSIKILRTEISFLKFHRSGITVKTFFPVVFLLALVYYLNMCRNLCIMFSFSLFFFPKENRKFQTCYVSAFKHAVVMTLVEMLPCSSIVY